MSTTHSSFDQYCISHITLVVDQLLHLTGPEVRRECPMTSFPALPLLAMPLTRAVDFRRLCLLQIGGIASKYYMVLFSHPLIACVVKSDGLFGVRCRIPCIDFIFCCMLWSFIIT